MSTNSAEPAVEIFTQEYCPACRQVEALLTKYGIPFQSRDVLDDADALEEIASRGYMSTPVTRIGDTWVGGYDHERLIQLIEGTR